MSFRRLAEQSLPLQPSQRGPCPLTPSMLPGNKDQPSRNKMNLLPKQLGRFSPNLKAMFGKVALKTDCAVCARFTPGGMHRGGVSQRLRHSSSGALKQPDREAARLVAGGDHGWGGNSGLGMSPGDRLGRLPVLICNITAPSTGKGQAHTDSSLRAAANALAELRERPLQTTATDQSSG